MLRDPTLVVPEGPEAIGRRAQRLARENYAIRSAPLAVLKLLDGAIDLARELGRDELLSTDLTGYVARDLNTPREMVERDGKALFASLQQQLLGEVVAQDVAVERVAQAVAFGERTSTGTRRWPAS